MLLLKEYYCEVHRDAFDRPKQFAKKKKKKRDMYRLIRVTLSYYDTHIDARQDEFRVSLHYESDDHYRTIILSDFHFILIPFIVSLFWGFCPYLGGRLLIFLFKRNL